MRNPAQWMFFTAQFKFFPAPCHDLSSRSNYKARGDGRGYHDLSSRSNYKARGDGRGYHDLSSRSNYKARGDGRG